MDNGNMVGTTKGSKQSKSHAKTNASYHWNFKRSSGCNAMLFYLQALSFLHTIVLLFLQM
jgi:hypothetical protein